MNRWDIINYYIQKYNFKTFLEIGHANGEGFNNVVCELKESIDPDVSCNATYQITSDEFFEKYDKKYDIIFIDGLHECSQVDRDIKNSLKHLNNAGVIVMHDCHPDSESCQRKDFVSHQNGENWTGDTWKAYVKNRAELPYEMYVWDNDWGCGIIDTNVNKITNTTNLPTDMEKLTYKDFLQHSDWMNFKKEAV